MARHVESPKTERVVLSLTPDQFSRLCALANIEGVPAAVCVREIIERYMDTRADEIKAALEANAAFQNSLNKIRNRNN